MHHSTHTLFWSVEFVSAACIQEAYTSVFIDFILFSDLIFCSIYAFSLSIMDCFFCLLSGYNAILRPLQCKMVFASSFLHGCS